MAGDWIKMRTDIYRHPKVCAIADLLGQMEGVFASHTRRVVGRDMGVTRNALRNVTVGALVSVWGVLRHRGERRGDDLVVVGASLATIDDIADTPGLGDAMAGVGWAVIIEDALKLPGFFKELNVEPTRDAHERNAERQRRHREKRNALRNVTVTLQSNARERERVREEIVVPAAQVLPPTPPTLRVGGKRSKQPAVTVDSPPIPEALAGSASFVDTWAAWIAHRAEISKPLKPTGARAALKSLARAGPDAAAAMLLRSIENGWQGFFPLKDERDGRTKCADRRTGPGQVYDPSSDDGLPDDLGFGTPRRSRGDATPGAAAP